MTDYKQIVTGPGTLERALEGVAAVAEVVAVTLGPSGRPVLIERRGQNAAGEPMPPLVTKDGVTVAESVFLKDPVADAAAQTAKAICRGTNATAGDGTTTAIVLGHAIVKAALPFLTKNPESGQRLRVQIEHASAQVVERVTAQATPCDVSLARAVALISANGDEDVAEAVQSAYDLAGPNGVIIVDQGGSKGCSVERVDGYQFRRGALAGSQFFNTKDGLRFEAEEALVLLVNDKILDPSPLSRALTTVYQEFNQSGKPMPPVIVVADEFSSQVLHMMAVAKLESGIQICPVESPEVTTSRTALLDDLAVYVGGRRLGGGSRSLASLTAEELMTEFLGRAEKVSVSSTTTTIFQGAGSEDSVGDRIDVLRAQKDVATNQWDVASLSDRIASLSGGLVRLLVGGTTEVELKERYHRVEDAVNAVASALEMGVLPGGGVALLKQAFLLHTQEDLTQGGRILATALSEPYLRIRENHLGVRETFEVAMEDAEHTPENYADNLRTDRTGPFLEVGVMDPAKVTITALRNAVSVATLVLSCGGIVVSDRS